MTLNEGDLILLRLGLLARVGLLGQQDGLDVGKDASLSDGHAREQLVQLLVVTYGELEMTWNDPGLLVVAGSVAGKLEDLGGQVFHDGSEVDGGSSADAFGIVPLAKETMDSSDWKLQSSAGRSGLCLSLQN